MNLVILSVCGMLASPGQSTGGHNFDFRTGPLAGWEGNGFYLTTSNPRGPSAAFGVCSSDAGSPERTGMLRYVFTVPDGAGEIRFRAFAALGKGCKPSQRLDVLLLGQGNGAVPKKVWQNGAWRPATNLLPREHGTARDYSWDVSDYAGQTLQIVLLDRDDRPGCHVFCSGFRPVQRGVLERQQFARDIHKLETDKKLAPLARFESKHFTAWSNADDDFTVMRLRNCELLYDSFLSHFRRKGFALRPPSTKLMVAIFDSQAGFEAYLGEKASSGLVGVYHPKSNRLVVYDTNGNSTIQASRKQALAAGKHIALDLDRLRYVDTIERQTRELCKDINIGVTMHEAAHLISFNCGLLNRDGDVPLWLAEGLACYCEPTDQGAWLGIGETNRQRLGVLTDRLRKRSGLLPFAVLVGKDDWRKSPATVLLGYAQSWALFRMLMHERPEALQKYLALIHARQAPEHRLTDFRQVFGADLTLLEKRLQRYIGDLVERYLPPR